MFDGGEIRVLAASFIVFAALLLLRRSKQNRVKDDGKRYPPSISVLPVLAAIIRGGLTMLPEHLMRTAEKRGSVFSFTTGGRLVVVLNGRESIFDALVRHSEAFADRDSNWLEENITNRELRGIGFARYNDAYKKHRKLTLSIFKELGFGVQSVSETRIMQEIESMHDELLKLNGRPFDPKWSFKFATANVVHRVLFGKKFPEILPKLNHTIVTSAVECFSNMDLAINVAPVLRFLPVFRRKIERLRTSSERLLNAIEKGIEFVISNKSEPTFVGRFLEIEGPNYDHQYLLFVLRDLCFGSADTVSDTLQFAMVELANHPEIQKRLQREIDEVVPGYRFPSFDDKLRLTYTEAVILEVTRRHTIAPLCAPHASLRDTKVLQYDIPGGSKVIANAYSAHMDPASWKDPENFRPERFLDRDNKFVNSRKVIAFGLGKRSCIGEIIAREKIFLFLTSLVQRFDIRPPEGQTTIDVKEVTAVTTAPSHFKVRLIQRMKPTEG